MKDQIKQHNIHYKLKDYQLVGIKWMLKRLKSAIPVCLLADDMGLGKTLQTIVTISYFINNNKIKKGHKILIITPKTLISNWLQEFNKFAPKVKVHSYTGKKRDLDLCSGEVILTTYSTATRDIKQLVTLDYFLLVLDEAHEIRNSEAKQTKAIKKLIALKKIALTGTPLINNFDDVVSIFDFLKKGYLDDYKKLASTSFTNKKLTNEINKKIDYLMLRRFKDKNTTNLPNKHIKYIKCSLTPEQKTLYNLIPHKIRTNYKKLYRTGLLIAAKNICNHPTLYQTSKKKLSINQSGKMLQVYSIINSLDIKQKLLIFSPSKKTIKLLANLLQRKKINVLLLHGEHSIQQRTEIVLNFQNTALNHRVLLISLKAGSAGLNLTAANHVIHFDPWWNFASINQASDRVYRIGQQHAVTIYYLITEGTLEQSIYNHMENKQKINNIFFNKQPAKISRNTKEKHETSIKPAKQKKEDYLKNKQRTDQHKVKDEENT